MNRLFLTVLVAAIYCVTPSHAWWCMGHMLVAEIAKKYLQKYSPDSFTKIDELIGIQAEYSPLSPDFVTTACWADDVKSTSRLEASWHFINYALIGDNPPKNAIPSNSKYDYTIVWALDNINGTLSRHDTRTSSLEQARLLAWLIHFAGDIHQPLHASTMYSATHEGPVGDMGGNAYKIKSYKGMSNLHSFWDSVAGVFTKNPQRPLSPADAEDISTWADRIIAEYPINTFSKAMSVASFNDWAVESWAVSRDLAYATPEYADLTQEYIDAAQDACMQRLALGGYRLGLTLSQLFSKSGVVADHSAGGFSNVEQESFRNLL